MFCIKTESNDRQSEKFRGGGISVELFIYLLLFVTANIIDWIIALSDAKELETYLRALYIVSVIVVVMTGVILKKGKIILWHMVGKADCIPLIFLLLLALIRLPIPDASFDTLNYHLFWQDSFGEDIIRNHFFPTRVINSLFFCLGDRTYHIFRQLLGYRGGTILGTLALMLIYLQGKIFLQKTYFVITGKEPERKHQILASIMSLLCILVEQILIYVDTYYVDWLAIPFLAEVLLRIFFADKQEDKDIWILGVMAGVCVCIKPSNAVYVLLLVLIYIAKFYKNIQWWTWICGMTFCIFVCIPYICVGYRMTGNPTFPYLNGLFKSEWFFFMGVDEYSGMKDLFGPASLKEYIFWPYYMTFRPNDIHFADNPQYCGRLLVALIVGIASIARTIMTKKSCMINRASEFFICVYILYLTCINGHLRYALFMEWFAGIVLAVGILTLLNENGLKRCSKVVCIGFLALSTIFSIRWAGKYILSSNVFVNKDNWLQNAKYLFHDYEKTNLPVTDIGGFIVFDTNGSMMSMLDIDVPIVNLKSGALTEAGKSQSEIILSNIEEKGKIYSLSKPNALIQLADEIRMQGYSIESVYTIKMPSMVNTSGYCYLVSVRKEEKEILVCEGEKSEKIVFDSSLAGKKLNILVGRKWSGMSDKTMNLKICVDANEEIIGASLNTNGEFYQYEMQLPDDIETGIEIELNTETLQNKWMIVEY